MKPRSAIREYSRTKYIQLDSRKCKACWKCQNICTNSVIGRINLPFHKHVRINNSINCKGCLKCIDVCESNALSKVPIT